VLDANATLMLAMEPLSLDGRIQVVRIGQQHLLDMLDVVDPYQENVNMNRARMGLQVGYPEFLRLKMKDGFLAIKLKLGGAASAIRLDEIKGIALGPFLNTYVAPALSE
jgi:translocation and assembly module TamB